MEEMKILVADDDESWILRLERVFYCSCVYADNLVDALRLIEDEPHLDAGIFDRVLPSTSNRDSDDLQCPLDHMNAGFFLAIAFHRRFPRGRTVVCSGAPLDMFDTRGQFQRVVDREHCIFLDKNRSAVEEVFHFLKSPPLEKDFDANALDYFLLQPNLFGMGIKLGTVIQDLVSYARRRMQN